MDTIHPRAWIEGTVGFVYTEEIGTAPRGLEQTEEAYSPLPLGQVEAGKAQSCESSPAARHPSV